MKANWKKWLIEAAVVAACLVVAARFIDAHRNDKTKADLADAKVTHAAHVEQQKFQAHVDTVVDTLWRTEKSHAAKADSFNVASDTAGQHSITLRDTANMWHQRWQLRGVAYASLDSAKKVADARADTLTLARDSARVDAARLDSLNTRLSHDLEHANDCHILPFVPCPSRKVAFVVGAATASYFLIPPDERKKVLVKILTLGR
jgi:hypothetical protein